MSHLSTGTILNFVGPIFADPEARACLEPHQCAQIDAILQKETLSRRDRRRLVRGVEDVLMHDGHED